ncbi:MAG: DUF3460 family protein [Betaproteobacteria bacterium]|nr:DUF3460 family protein [Betaproteobacteria bacterium]
MALYVSDHTQFMRSLLARNPEWVSEQKIGRAIWWEKTSDQEQKKAFDAAKVAPKAYPYDVNFNF